MCLFWNNITRSKAKEKVASFNLHYIVVYEYSGGCNTGVILSFHSFVRPPKS